MLSIRGYQACCCFGLQASRKGVLCFSGTCASAGAPISARAAATAARVFAGVMSCSPTASLLAAQGGLGADRRTLRDFFRGALGVGRLAPGPVAARNVTCAFLDRASDPTPAPIRSPSHAAVE